MRASPLLHLADSRPLVYLPASVAGQAALETISAQTFLQRAQALASALPATTAMINVCHQRYHFLLAFCAALIRQQTNLLPPNRTASWQEKLLAEYSDSYLLHDGFEPVELGATGSSAYDIRQLLGDIDSRFDETAASNPDIPADHVAAIVFTSGSTGASQAITKTWRTFVASTRINAAHMLPHETNPMHVLATVPGQHMYGMETSILLPLLTPTAVMNASPLYPQDVANALAELPEPRLLVSTPVHLKALLRSDLEFPPVTRVLSATAPLPQADALALEQRLDAQVVEIYGCSEVGSLASRRTAQDDSWRLFDGLSRNGTTISAAHLPAAVTLQDNIVNAADGGFVLAGRQQDMVNIAGKRGSLQELNKVLLAAPGVEDGIVIQTDDASRHGRVAALVSLLESAESTEVRVKKISSHFRAQLDPVFVPRPIYVVGAIPREENGKLPRKKVEQLFRAERDKRKVRSAK